MITHNYDYDYLFMGIIHADAITDAANASNLVYKSIHRQHGNC